MSNQNAGYTMQTPAVAFAANLGSLRSNIQFYGERGELSADTRVLLMLAANDLAVAIESIKKQGDGP